MDLRPLWANSELNVSHIPLHADLEKTLIRTLGFKQIERGLEHITQVLNQEQKGLVALQKKQNREPSYRVSRLLLVANDGSERFYRDCEKIIHQQGDRVLLIRIDVPSTRLAQNLLGPDQVLKILLVSDKDAVSNVLFSLVVESKIGESK
jgi:hypothetical protein